MLIINADDWGRSTEDTDSIRACYEHKRVSSVSAMVFMQDSERAARLATEAAMDVGLHLNLTEAFNSSQQPARAERLQLRTRQFLNANKYALLVYNPLLKGAFAELFRLQLEEFLRLYGKPPSHFDGHQHMHLSANMIFDRVIPNGEKVRRSFSFWPGEKSVLNRAYRRLIDSTLTTRFRVTDFFFALSQTLRSDRQRKVRELAKAGSVELMTHPRSVGEFDFLMSDNCGQLVEGLSLLGYAAL